MDHHVLSNGMIWLSAPTMDDVDTITECCQEPSIGEWVTVPVPYVRENAVSFIEDMVVPGWSSRSPIWAVRLHPDGPVVGTISLGRRDESSAEIGFWLIPAQRSRGLMTQAVNMVCDFGFRADRLDLERIGWRAYVGNYASAAVARRAGFRYEGLSRLGSVQRGRRRDHWFAARLRTDPPGPAAGWPAEFDRTTTTATALGIADGVS
ncbi:GNAT family N-acetyltransferase [Nocardia sp. NBC_00508]|uniref:GNAT family N-acetyltransferase n=1 Tax=Nocardia sp. NBC_00508 TaxID=2975992 RepID=UPI002E80E699|nr:GNAT family N-acetyltransferase [Nocardia sp. NBC_00508]WUD63852.1 GNAT family N-acetyltransferase [Nocardia sp. NBC_00508]